MKLLLTVLMVCFLSSAMAADKKANDPVSKMWQEMLKEKKEYAKMKKSGASAEELKLQATLIKELYATVIAMKKEKYGDGKVEKKAEEKSAGPIGEAWQKVLTAKKKYSTLEKKGASDEKLTAQKKYIDELYKKVVAMKKEKYKK